MTTRSPRILIVRLSAIGDVIHVLPAFAALRAAYPRAHIGWVIEDSGAELLRGLRGLDALHIVPRQAWRRRRRSLPGRLLDVLALSRELRAGAYDVAIDFQGLTKSGVAAWLSRAPVRIGYGDGDGRELNKLFTNRQIVPDEARVHVIDRNAALLTPLGIEDRVGPHFPLVWDETDAQPMRDFVQSLSLGAGKRVAMLNPGAGWVTKRWGPERFGALAKRLVAEDGFRVVAAWSGGEEEQMARRIIQAAGNGAQLAPPTTLRQLAALLDQTDVLVSSDTGPMHLAVALGVPTVALFGPSDARRNGPYAPPGRTRVVSAGVSCSPCWLSEGCPYGIRCMKEISVDEVLQAVRELMATPEATRSRR